ncbi:hypothetical protein RJ639_015126 [Escallonia herrerae]|uniref:BZIP domain-containing protein n=1 Tax=Escallonia herrerae TaxID=1293975 RepID=A0AA89AMM9_9ASTE|nr:hypothetical protein RJ639_015126 [Escallonia herrerae]
MASSSGTSSGSSLLQNSGSEEDLQQLMDQRKRKRMISNRESARRSRMKKQKHLDDLMKQVAQLRKENNLIITNLSVTSEHYLNVESENSVLRAQVGELSHRLQSLTEIISFMNDGFGTAEVQPNYNDGFMNNGLNYLYVNQPLMASADMLQY